MENKSKTQKKRSYRKGKFEPKTKDSGVSERMSGSKCNDPSWYIREGQLAKDVASFSFNTALGMPAELQVDGVSNSGVKGHRFYVPGIMAIQTAPAVGYSRSGASPINLAAKNLYSWVRHANSGHANYDSPDLMLYLVAMDSMYALIWHLQRAYGTARVYSQKNRYIGDALLTAMGFNASEVRANLADFRSYINMLIVKVSAFCTPTTMSLFRRHTWMYSGIFRDEDVEKSQMYLYVPAFLYQYNENAGAGKCDPIPICVKELPSGTGMEERIMPLSMWRLKADTMIAALVGSEDINIMSGDIRKAYGENNIWKIQLIPEDFAVVPIYSGEILDQIHNTIFTGGFPRHVIDTTDPSQFATYDLTDLTIYQDVSDPLEPIKYHPFFTGAFSTSIEHPLDMEENEPSPERVLVATRNMIHGITNKYTISGSDYFITEVDSIGSDLCFYADMYQFDSTGGLVINKVGYNQPAYIDVGAYTKFHKAPLNYKFTLDSDNDWALEEVLGEVGDFIIVDYTDIDKMHQSAILSMLGVPV